MCLSKFKTDQKLTCLRLFCCCLGFCNGKDIEGASSSLFHSRATGSSSTGFFFGPNPSSSSDEDSSSSSEGGGDADNLYWEGFVDFILNHFLKYFQLINNRGMLRLNINFSQHVARKADQVGSVRFGKAF